MHPVFVPVEITPPSLGFFLFYYKYTKKANYFCESFIEEKKKRKTRENEKKGEIAACSPLACTAKQDSLKFTFFFFLSSLGYTSEFNLEAVSSGSD